MRWPLAGSREREEGEEEAGGGLWMDGTGKLVVDGVCG